jgi:hypothetical protein
MISTIEYDTLIHSFYNEFSYDTYICLFPTIPKLYYPEIIKRAIYARRYEVIEHIHRYVSIRDYIPSVSYEHDDELTAYIISLRKYTPDEWRYIKVLLF